MTDLTRKQIGKIKTIVAANEKVSVEEISSVDVVNFIADIRLAHNKHQSLRLFSGEIKSIGEYKPWAFSDTVKYLTQK